MTLTATVDAGTPPPVRVSQHGVYPQAWALTLLTRNQDLLTKPLSHRFRGGEGAGLSCGDLILTNGLPAQRTLGEGSHP
ncbi:MAG: hypothetical protein IPF77_15985 [Gemmatimonadetes bacterium]|nr:hypothetical protein [Gemmatimonadota bacterium]